MTLSRTDEANLVPRLVDYVVLVGSRHPYARNQQTFGASSATTPSLLRRYPPMDHKDFPLSPDVVFFCQPEGCINTGQHRMCLRETTSFVFTLTEKDSGLVRYGICLNFYRPIERRTTSVDEKNINQRNPRMDRTESSTSGSDNLEGSISHSSTTSRTNRKVKPRSHTLTSLCIISHHPFFSKFRQCLYVLKKIIEKCHEKSKQNKGITKESVWSILTGASVDCPSTSMALHDVREIESWILRLLSAPIPVPGKTRVNLTILPESVQDALIFALPDKTRLSLCDFSLHLPLELLGVDTCLKVLTCIMLEQKVVLQSRDYNTLTMSVMALTAMLYPLQYMFPVIPLLPVCMLDTEQLLLAPTPYIIGIPASFLHSKKDFKLPADVWLVDLDTNKLLGHDSLEALPLLPELEGMELGKHLQQALISMSTAQPIANLEHVANSSPAGLWKDNQTNTIHGISSTAPLNDLSGFNPLIYGNDADSVDVATRVAMVKFFNSPNVLGNFSEHTRTLRLYPRPVVAFQYFSFMKSRQSHSLFTQRLAKTQAVEYFAEWSLCPENVVYQRIHTGSFDPLQIGDKPKWYMNSLIRVDFRVCRETNCTLHLNWTEDDARHSDVPTDESGSDSDGVKSSSSIYSNYSDLVADMADSGLSADLQDSPAEFQRLTIDLDSVYTPPTSLYLPDSTETAIPPSSSDDDADSSDQKTPVQSESSMERQGSVSRPPRPPPPTRAGSVGVHPGTPKSLSGGDDSSGSSTPGPQQSGTNSAQKEQGHSHFQFPPPSLVNEPASLRYSNDRSHPRNNESLGDVLSGSLFTNIGDNISDAAANATNRFTEFLGSKPLPGLKSQKPYAPLGNRKALVEKSGLAKQATNMLKQREAHSKLQHQPLSIEQQRNNALGVQNQIFLKEVVQSVLDGKIIGIMNRGKVKKLMEDENYRNFVVSRLNVNLEKKISDPEQHVEDVPVNKHVFKAMGWIIELLVQGLAHSCMNRGLGGMASAFMLLEIAHTHYLQQSGPDSQKSDSSLSSSPAGSQESLARKSEDSNLVSAVGNVTIGAGSNGELRGPVPNKAAADDLALRKEGKLQRYDSFGSENSTEFGNSLAVPDHYGSQAGGSAGGSPGGGSPAGTPQIPKVIAGVLMKSRFSKGMRYLSGQMVKCSVDDRGRIYLFENLISKDRSTIWNHMQFWEDAFLDAVGQERDIVGMDQGLNEMIDRYTGLEPSEKKRLELDEDRLLGALLFNMASFMVMMKVDKNDLKRKVRRMLAKCHIGRHYSQEINNVLDNIQHLHANDIDLKPMVSRLMQKQCFTVHWGDSNQGDMLFMEVCDDCLTLRSVTGAIVGRWWYEKVVNMTACPKAKIFCLWCKEDGQTQLKTFYSKKSRELYVCVKDSMTRAGARGSTAAKKFGGELGGDYPVCDYKTGEAGILNISTAGIAATFPTKRSLLQLNQIKRCYPLKNDILVIEYIDPVSHDVRSRKYKTAVYEAIIVTLHRLFSVEFARQTGRHSAVRGGSDETSPASTPTSGLSPSSSSHQLSGLKTPDKGQSSDSALESFELSDSTSNSSTLTSPDSTKPISITVSDSHEESDRKLQQNGHAS